MARKRTGKPVGAPSKGPYKNLVPMTARVPQFILDLLQSSADANGCSRNQEIALRLDHSFTHYNLDVSEFGSPQNLAVCRLIGMMLRNYHAFEGEELWNNADTHEELKDAVVALLDAFGPDGGVPAPHKDETAGHRRGRSKLEQLTQNKTLAAPIKVEGKIIERTSDQYSFMEIWKALGPLNKKLEVKK
jgi:hypothetical protein